MFRRGGLKPRRTGRLGAQTELRRCGCVLASRNTDLGAAVFPETPVPFLVCALCCALTRKSIRLASIAPFLASLGRPPALPGSSLVGPVPLIAVRARHALCRGCPSWPERRRGCQLHRRSSSRSRCFGTTRSPPRLGRCHPCRRPGRRGRRGTPLLRLGRHGGAIPPSPPDSRPGCDRRR